MKKQFYFFLIIFSSLAVFHTSTATAGGSDRDRGGKGGSPAPTPTPSPSPAPSTGLPINNGVELLMIAGIVIGIVAVKKAKAVNTAAKA